MSTPEFAAFEMKETPPADFQHQASAIPKALADHFAALGMECKSTSSRPDISLPKYRHRGYSPILWSELPKEVQRKLTGGYDRPERNNDEVRLGDSILLVRSIGAGDYWENAEKDRARAVMGQTTLGDQQMVADEINARAKQTFGKSALIIEETELSRRPAAEHVRGGVSTDTASEFNQEVRDELKRRREEIPD